MTIITLATMASRKKSSNTSGYVIKVRTSVQMQGTQTQTSGDECIRPELEPNSVDDVIYSLSCCKLTIEKRDCDAIHRDDLNFFRVLVALELALGEIKLVSTYQTTSQSTADH